MTTDPYTPPPRHKDRSGAIVRFLFVAALLGGAAWGYMNFVNHDAPGLVAEEPLQQDLATNEDGYETGYEVTTRAPTADGASEAAPAQSPEPETPPA